MEQDRKVLVEEFPESTLIVRDIEKEMKDAFLDYSMSVIVARALPDVRDGLKPVHRRILYTMYERGNDPQHPFKKSADTVGAVLGSYHPHGDASVYDAMVRLAQDFSLRYPLVEGQGNFGSVDGDPPAAYRYTEARMSRVAMGMTFEMDDFVSGTLDRMDQMEADGKVPNQWLALVPPAAVVLTLNFIKASYWDIHISLLCGVLLCAILFYKNLSAPLAVLNKGANNSIVAIMNTGAVIGIGAVIRATPAFSSLVEAVLGMGGNPLIAFGAATSVVAGATASGQGGLGIALAALAEPYMAAGVSPEILHRVGTIACLGLDSLPHNGAIITLLVMTGMDHRKSYMPIFWTTVVITTVALAMAIVLGSIFYPIGA
jgi:hypothetical protein